MNEFNDAAKALFPTMALATPPSRAPAVSAEQEFQEAADLMFGETSPKPPAVKPAPRAPGAKGEEDEITKAENFYRDSPIHGSAERAIESTMLEQLATPEEAQAVVAEWAPLFSEFQLSSTESAQLTDIGVAAAVNAPSQETIDGWAESARAGLRQDFGDRAGEALQCARALIAKSPKLKAFLDESGLGNHPSYVRLAAAKGLELRRRGKL